MTALIFIFLKNLLIAQRTFLALAVRLRLFRVIRYNLKDKLLILVESGVDEKIFLLVFFISILAAAVYDVIVEIYRLL
jgi:hypothetical protein